MRNVAEQSIVPQKNMPATATAMVPSAGFSAENALALLLAKAEKSEERETQLARFIGAANTELQIAKEEREKGHLIVNKLTSDVSSISDQMAELKAQVDAGVSVQHSLYDPLFHDPRSMAVRFVRFFVFAVTVDNADLLVVLLVALLVPLLSCFVVKWPLATG